MDESFLGKMLICALNFHLFFVVVCQYMNSDGQFFGKSTYQSTIHWKIVCVDMVFFVFV